MRALAPLFLLTLAACTSQAQQPGPAIMDSGGPLDYDRASYDVTFYDLALAVDPAARALDGEVTVWATMVQPNDHLVLDLDTVFAVHGARVGAGGAARATPFERRGGQVRVYLGGTQQPGTPVTVTVAYGGVPRVARRAPWDGGFVWAETDDGQPWIATAVQGEGADVWWPTKDHPSDEPDSMALTFTVPKGLVVASNGRLRGVDELDEQVRYRWFVSTPINNYGVALNVGPYEERTTTYTSVAGERFPLVLYVLPQRLDRAAFLLQQMRDHMAFYEDWLGPYPFRADKYGVVHTPHLGMEHQTIIAYGSDFDAEPEGFDWLHHHEFGHEWWANLVTAWDWRDFWIHEGFCTYMQGLYREQLQGEAGMQAYLESWRGAIRNTVPVAPRAYSTTDDVYFAQRGSNPDIYYKGALVLHSLRYLLGDARFRTSLRRFAYPTPEMERITDGTQARFVTTDDYVGLVSDLAGEDLGWFFDVYVRQPDLPRLAVERDGDRLRLRWDVPEGRPFPMPVEVEVGGVAQRVEMPEGRAEVVLPHPDARVVVDPRHHVLRAE